MLIVPAEIDPLGGSARSTIEGTVKDPSEVLAVQVKDELTNDDVPTITKLVPVIWTVPLGSPPVQVMGRPLARVTVAALAWLVQTKAGGTVICFEKFGTSTPPGAVTVYWPGSRYSPVADRVAK
jgi:hypothetical protein